MIDRPPPPPHAMPTRIAVAHDWLCGVRGGEHVLERVCALVENEFEPVGLFTMFDDHADNVPTVNAWRRRGLVRSSRLNPFVRALPGLRRWLLPLYPSCVRQLSGQLSAEHARIPIDLVISTSSAAIKGLRPPPGVPHICICFSPARYVWGDGSEYRADGTVSGRLRSLGLTLLGGRFRTWDRRTASNVSYFLAISRHIQQRIRVAYSADSTILYPPVRTAFFTPDPTIQREDFWLFVSALEPYKRADLAIAAARQAGVRLVIAGSGSQLARLRREAAGDERITVMGRVSDEQLRDLYRRARLLIFPQVEDFGIVALEAQACGLPVVARGLGGALDTVIDGVTGSLFTEPTPEAIIAAAQRAPSNQTSCRQQAERFSEQRFDDELRRVIQKVLAEAATSSSPR